MLARRIITRGFGGQQKMTTEISNTLGVLPEVCLNTRTDVQSPWSKQPVAEGRTRTAAQQLEEADTVQNKFDANETAQNDGDIDVLMRSLSICEQVDTFEESSETFDDTYAQDIHSYLKTIEQKCCPTTPFLDDGHITASNRRVLVAWMRDVQEYLQIHQQTFHLALTITDLFVQMSSSVQLSEYQLLGLVGLLIAAKYLERYVPQIDTLMYLASYAYDSRAILNKEKEVLRILDYDLNLPTPSWFLEYYTKDDKTTKVHEVAELFLDLFALDPESTTNISPSVRAASALMTATRLLAQTTDWQQRLVIRSGCSSDRLQHANQRLQVLLNDLNTKQKCSLDQTIVDVLSSIQTTG